MTEEFDFDATRRRFPEHWDDRGWPAVNSTWRSRNHPQLRVRVIGVTSTPLGHDTDELPGDVRVRVYWDGDLAGLRLLFTYESTDRWNIDKTGLVYGSGGIDREGRWRREGPTLEVIFERPMFGGPDTWHINFEERLPFFEPLPDWDEIA